MPFSLIPLALGASFLLLWLFIASNILSDRMATVRGTRWLEEWLDQQAQTARPHQTKLRGPHRRRRSRRTQLAAGQ